MGARLQTAATNEGKELPASECRSGALTEGFITSRKLPLVDTYLLLCNQ